ncbi:hypothetical protein GGE20_005126 [Rhizobium leguminosarum]|nr:hypothetical protein [Rhizobium leguminosarum]
MFEALDRQQLLTRNQKGLMFAGAFGSVLTTFSLASF